METERITLKTFLMVVFSILAAEILGPRVLVFPGRSPFLVLGILRGIEAALIFLIVFLSQKSSAALKIEYHTICFGIKRGLFWCTGIGCLAVLGAMTLFLLNQNPLDLIRMSLPSSASGVFQLFLVGGIVGPLVEELMFRGVIYSYFRQWGFFTAVVISTVLFASLHSSQAGFPLIQLVGGMLFAGAYEIEKNLMVPMVIHMLGNMAIFSLAIIFV